MKGIVGRKLGMTQVFDEETGVVTPVTVIQAGPCPVVAIKTAEADGYDAVQLAFDEVPERKVTKPRLGVLKKAGVGPHRRLLEIRGPHVYTEARRSRSRPSSPATRSRSPGSRSGRASPGRSSGTTSAAARSRTARTTSARPARSARRRRRRASSRARRWPARWARKRVTQVGLRVHAVDPEENLLLVKGAVPGPKNAHRRDPRGGAWWRLLRHRFSTRRARSRRT